jgi:hypothetical protein
MSRLLFVTVLCLVAASCKTYDQHMEPVHREFYDNSPERSVETLEGYLAPSAWSFNKLGEYDYGLLRLELASALQADGKYARAARELEIVDQELEVLDYSKMPLKDIAAFIFASDVPWRATPPERLLVNTQGMINRLAQRQNPDYLSEAAVEAARLRTLLTQGDIPEEDSYPNAFANGLAGFCMEQRGRQGEAEDFWKQVTGFNPLLPTPREPSDAAETGTVLVIVQMGKAPIRRQYRVALPVDGNIYQLRIPVMAERPDSYRTARVLVDGVDRGEATLMFDLGEHLMAQYKRDRPRLIAAAATQLASRAFISKSLGAAAGSDRGDNTAAFVEFFANLFLAEVQPPDTRCWSLAPQSFHVMRLDLPPGEHEISVVLDGKKHRNLAPTLVDVQPRRPFLINIVSDCFRTWSEKEEKRELMPADADAAEVAQWEGIEEAEAQARTALGSAK